MTDELHTPETPTLGADGFLQSTAGDSGSTETVASEPPKKRGPGRPRKDGASSGAPPTERPGAAKTAPNKPQKRGEKMTQEKITLLGKQLVGLHIMAARMSGIPELEIHAPEGEILAHGIAAVAEEYGLSLDGKTGAALSLLGACAMIYAPRFIQVQQRIRRAQSTVVDANGNTVQ